MADVVQLAPRENMTVEECLDYARTEHSTDVHPYSDVMVLAWQDDKLVVRSSGMSRKDAVWMLLAALDHARGLG